MQRKVRHHAAAHELLAHEVLHQRATLLGGQLMRQRSVDLARQLGIDAGLHFLHRGPQLLAVGQPGRRVLGHHDLAMGHPLAAAVVVGLAAALVAQFLAGPVGRRGHGIVRPLLRRPVQVLAALAPPQHLGREVIDRQRRLPSTPVASRRHLRRLPATPPVGWVAAAHLCRAAMYKCAITNLDHTPLFRLLSTHHRCPHLRIPEAPTYVQEPRP